MDRIKDYLNRCFDEYVMSEELLNLKQEIFANVTDHYADMISQGMDPEEAQAEVRASLGDIPALLGELGAEKKRPARKRFDPFGSGVFREMNDSVSSLFSDLCQEQGENGTLKQEFADIEAIEITGISMDIHVCASTDGKVHAMAEGNLDQISFEVEDSTLSVEESGSGSALFQSALDLYLELPETVRSMDAQVVSGDLTMGGISMDSLRFESASGDLEIRSGRAGDIAVKTASGDVSMRLRELGRFYGELSSGDVNLRCDQCGSLLCTCQSGDIDAQITEDFSTILFKTVSGDISLKTAPALAVNAQLSTISGTIDSFRTEEAEGRSVRIRTVSGDIRVR